MNATPFTLTGRLVRLEPLTAGHLDALCACGLAPEVWRTTIIRVATRDDMAAYLQRALGAQAAGTAVPFAIIAARTGTMVGSTRFLDLAPADRSVEIGATFLAPAWQRTGLNTEAKLLLLQHAFETWGCLRVQFTAHAINEKSRAALRRLGAKEEAIFRQHRVSPHHGPCDVAVYSILAAEWPEVKRNLAARLAQHAATVQPSQT